jgi:hypothetical protein
MTTFAELEALVVAQTRRPEIPAITQAAIRAAVLRAHHVDNFPRDLAAGTLNYTIAEAYFYDFPNLSSLLPRLRSVQLLQSTDTTYNLPVEELEYRELADLYDADGALRPHIYTLIGETLRVYPTAQTGKLTAYFYQNPVVSSAGFSSWIANEFPDELAMWAAGIVWARTGFMDMAADTNKTHVQPFKELLLTDYLLANVT